MVRSRARLCLLALAFAYLLALLFHNLGSFPALHGDEAWTGLTALWIKDHGLTSIHGMNSHSGSVYPWLVSRAFMLLEPDGFSLRLSGAFLNALAALILGLHLGRKFGPASAVAWIYLLATSSLFVFKSRLAWEVYGLQNLLLAVILVSSRRMVEEKAFSTWNVLAFLASTCLGVLNHFLFLSVPFSLAVALLAHLMLHRDWERLGYFRLSVLSLLMSVGLALLKISLTDARWQGHSAFFGALFLLAPPAFAAAFRFSGPLDSLIRRLLQDGFLAGPRSREALKGALLLGLAAYFLAHFTPMLQIWSNVAVFKRLVSWDPPWLLSGALYSWAAFLLGAYFLHAGRSLEPESFAGLSPHERLLLFWPLVYACLFILVTQTSSIRYYSLSSFLVMAALASRAPRILNLRRWALPLLLVALVLNVCFWKELAWPRDRKPMIFRIGLREERSSDFLRKEALHEFMRREGICALEPMNTFIEGPLYFFLATRSYPCDQGKRISARYCWECGKPPYFAWKVSHAP